MYPDAQRLEDISSIRDAMRQISLEAQAVVELLDVRMEDTHLDGSTEAEDVRSVLELIHSYLRSERGTGCLPRALFRAVER
jgi:hypothetical protein